MKIIVYTSPSCLYCHHLKDFLNENKIEFEEIDLGERQDMVEDFIKRTGQMAVPVTEIDGEMIMGFNIPKLNEKLNIK